MFAGRKTITGYQRMHSKLFPGSYNRGAWRESLYPFFRSLLGFPRAGYSGLTAVFASRFTSVPSTPSPSQIALPLRGPRALNLLTFARR